ncbi:hypothetical protein A4G18_00790 [Pasteurellaceae bacterium Pebbles2]|nr:hypothetical protein [Pasteurellaceae bacterium Pebbles2]
MANRFLILAALSGFICVAFGAFATHALQASFSAQQLNWVDTGWKYQAFHTLALLMLGIFVNVMSSQNSPKYGKTAVNIIGFSWLFGIVAFSFSLYMMAILNSKALAMIVPIGGVAFLIGWSTLFVVAVKSSLAK